MWIRKGARFRCDAGSLPEVPQSSQSETANSTAGIFIRHPRLYRAHAYIEGTQSHTAGFETLDT